MNRFYFFAPFILSTLACSGAAPKAESGNQAVTTGSDSSKSSVDSAGCGDGVKSTPNVWFMNIPAAQADQGGLFMEVALMSDNLFWLQGITPVNPAAESGDLGYPTDNTQTTALIFDVNFTPGSSNSVAHINYRDQTLTQLQNMGAQIGCNQIGVAQPLSNGSGSSSGGQTTTETPDSAGCGDGVSSTPNDWFITVNRTDANAPLFDEIVLMASNLFQVPNVTAFNPSTDTGSLTYPDDTTQTSALNFEVTFSPGVNSLALPTVAEDSIAYRDNVLTTLANDDVSIECNLIGHVKPLSP